MNSTSDTEGNKPQSQVNNPRSVEAEQLFEVRLDVFEGPLDVLLRLIEKRQLEISKVSLAAVTTEFLAYIEERPGIAPGPLASFVWVASKLLWIKSQALLPRTPSNPAEESEEDAGDELIRRLEAYKRVQEVARWLRERDTLGLRSYERPAALIQAVLKPAPDGVDAALEGVTLAKLAHVAQKRMQMALPVAPAQGASVRGHTVTVAEKLGQLRSRLSRLKEGERIALGEEFARAATKSRTEVAVLLLAVLEVVRRKHGAAEQNELFGEIWLSNPKQL